MKSKPTDGHYRIKARSIYAPDGKAIATCGNSSRSFNEVQANLRLLKASWTMLELLKLMAAEFEPTNQWSKKMIAAARKVISEVEGE